MSHSINRVLSIIVLSVFIAAFGMVIISPVEDRLFSTIMGVSRSANTPKYPTQILKDNTWVVPLDQSASSGVIIYEDDHIQIQISSAQFLAYGRWILDNNPKQSNVTLPTLKELTEAAMMDLPATAHLPKYDFAKYRYAIGDILKSGHVIVYDKYAQSLVTTIKIQERVYICGPLCGSGDWLFYLPNGTLFFEVNYLKF